MNQEQKKSNKLKKNPPENSPVEKGEMTSSSSKNSTPSTPQNKKAPSKSQPSNEKEAPSKAKSNKNHQTQKLPEVKLSGLFAFKQGLSTVYDKKQRAITVTYLKYEPCYVSQIKSKNKEGYNAIQLAFKPKSFKKSTKSQRGHFKNTNFEHSAHYVREIKQEIPKGLQIGQKVALSSFSKGDKVKVTSRSKGKGFTGVFKRWGFGGGPASHGSQFHRNPGSIGNCTEPSRVMPGRKMPGHHGCKNQTLNAVEIIDMIPKSNTLLIKGPIPGARNTLVRLVKV